MARREPYARMSNQRGPDELYHVEPYTGDDNENDNGRTGRVKHGAGNDGRTRAYVNRRLQTSPHRSSAHVARC